MRRLLSLCLFAAILLPVLAPMLSPGAMAQTVLPACCRRGGAHQCMGNMAAAPSADGRTRAQAPRELCPYQQRAMVSAHHELSSVPAAQTSEAPLLQPLSSPSQAECLRRISFDRARQKRGPPTLLS